MQEHAFVEAWIIHCWHKLMHTQEQSIFATRDQVRSIISNRHGLELHNQQFERLKRKYISRDRCPASRLELVRQVTTGSPGVPSEFELVWLGWLFTEDPKWYGSGNHEGIIDEECPGPSYPWWLDPL